MTDCPLVGFSDASPPLFPDWFFLFLGTSGRKTGPPWAWRAAPASAWTKTAPCTSRRRGQGTSAHTPAVCSRLEATTRAVLTCVSGKGHLPRPREKEVQTAMRRLILATRDLGPPTFSQTYPGILPGISPSSVELPARAGESGLALVRWAPAPERRICR